MTTIERNHDTRHHLEAGGSGGGSPTGDLSAAREDASRCLEAGRAAIARGLSRDSQTFLQESRQQGGQ